MALTSKLNRAAPVGLAGLAVASGVQESKANPIIGYQFYDTNNVSVGTNLTLNVPYKLAVTLSGTNEPTKGINHVVWDLRMPSAGSYTNFMTVTDSAIPSGSLDFFNGYPSAQDISYNHINNLVNSAGDIVAQERDVTGTSTGPTNNWGVIGWYNFTPTALATNKKFGFNNVAVDYTSGSKGVLTSVDYARPGFNITVIPEPTTLALIVCLGAAAWARKRFRKFVGKH